MPRGRVSLGCSNLSVVIPRCIHQAARVKALRAGAPSLAAYVATVLDQAPEILTAAEQVQMLCMEIRIRATTKGDNHEPDDQDTEKCG